ncbi:hypothetical protein HNQ51_001297 [Inhella inkyongensis]|uniref:Glycosyltransferase subfamily 4-like N-terminal domain-containing protein n=1 Tax=Inhella inkyongensis TaxID=392593 RepID=A0A840S5B0_9BURK|nr:glycosyltransferase [Inhella inkyongensis]MBB5204004.1 hypothetical protein [Inhella inkyongensis]
MKRVLLIAYHFPPLAGSSGIQRTLRLAQQLPQFGWQPTVLTCQSQAYERTSPDLAAELPADLHVERAFALDTARHLAIAGRYWGRLARPDRWMSWRWDAVRRGLRLIREQRIDAIWSTYPIATAHTIGAELAARSGLPWVADFRDPMAQDGYPADPATHAAYCRIEEQVFGRARLATFTTPSALADYRARFPKTSTRLELLENGYDEASFGAAPQPEPLNPGRLTLLHSGIVYPSERDPTQLFEALAALKAQGLGERLRLRFRAAVHDELLRQLGAQHQVTEMVEILPAVGYRQALAEMQQADGLLVMQARNCNAQIPAKIYEYLRAGPAVLVLADRAGDTAQVLRAAGLQQQAQLDEASDIQGLLTRFAQDPTAPQWRPQPDAIQQASRLARSGQLASWLNQITS